MVAIAKEPRGCVGRRPWLFAPRARDAFRLLLEHLVPRGGTVLLPAYIGLSPLEGSGLADPLTALGLTPAFYRLGPDLQADLDDLRERLRVARPSAVLLVHYFGFPQRELRAIHELCATAEVPLIEDCAHAVLDLAEGGLGTRGDYAFWSLHKWLGCPGGGLLQAGAGRTLPAAPDSVIDPSDLTAFATADLPTIRARRRANYLELAALLADVPGVEVLQPDLPQDVVPLNLPVLLTHADRFGVYQALRAVDIGVIALYHTLHPWIEPDAYPEAHRLARRILNLPIHQDVDATSLPRIVEELRRAARG